MSGWHCWGLVPCLKVLGPKKDPMRERQRDTGEESNGTGLGLFSLDPTAPPIQAGLELIVVAIGRQFRRRFWAGGWCHQLHEVLAATGLHGAGHHCLFPTQQTHLGRVGSARPGSPNSTPTLCLLPTRHSQWWSGWGPASSPSPARTS